MTKDTLDSIQYLREVLRITHLEEGLSLVTITKKPLTLKRDVKIEKRAKFNKESENFFFEMCQKKGKGGPLPKKTNNKKQLLKLFEF
jgi:hypothetical protein